MFSKGILGAGAIIDAILIAATQYMGWPGYLQYVWALLALLWGIAVLMEK